MGSVSQEAETRMLNTFERKLKEVTGVYSVSRRGNQFELEIEPSEFDSERDGKDVAMEILDKFNPQYYNGKEYCLTASTATIQLKRLVVQTVVIPN